MDIAKVLDDANLAHGSMERTYLGLLCEQREITKYTGSPNLNLAAALRRIAMVLDAKKVAYCHAQLEKGGQQMPRNVRNFWIEAEVDERKTPIAFGPRGKDGGFRLVVYMRNKGEVNAVVQIKGICMVEQDALTLEVECKGRLLRIDRLR